MSLLLLFHSSVVYTDAASTVIGNAVISATDTEFSVDADLPTGVAVISALDTAAYLDTSTVVGNGIPSQSDTEQAVDSSTVSGVGVISAADTAAYLDGDTILGVGVISAQEAAQAVESVTVLGQGVISASDAASYLDGDSIIAFGSVSAVEIYGPFTPGGDLATVVGQAHIISQEVYYNAASHITVTRRANMYLTDSGRVIVRVAKGVYL